MRPNGRMVSRTPEGQLFFEIRGSFAKFERLKIRDRFQRGMRGKLRKGLPISDHHVFGYDWKDGNYVINPVQADIVRQCYAMYINGNGGYRFIIDWLESLRSWRIPHRVRIRQE